MFGIPDMVWLVTFGVISIAVLTMAIFTKNIVAWENGRIVKQGKDEPMSNAEIKRTIYHHRLFFGVLFVMNVASFIRYIDLMFM